VKTLAAIDNRIKVADRKVRLLSRLNPLNAKNEFKKFFTAYRLGKTYNPAFRYKPIKTDLAALARELKNLVIEVPPAKNERWFFTRHLENKRRRIIAKIRALNSRGTSKFKNHSRQLFGSPSSSQVAYAHRILGSSASRHSFMEIADSLSSRDAAISLQKYLCKRGLSWQVRIRANISSKAGLDSRSQYLLVRAGENFAPEEILSLAVHEVETHIYRRENGVRQNFPGLFSEGFGGPPTTEEGLALFNESQYNYDPRRLNIACARTLAVHYAKNRPFFYIFDKLRNYGIPDTYAWAATLRAKRGLSDTSRPGGFNKDHHYLKGYLEIKRFIENGGNLESLYIGKLNIGNIRTLELLKISVVKPKYLPIGLIRPVELEYDNQPRFAQTIFQGKH